MTTTQAIALHAFGIRPCGCRTTGRHEQGCATLAARRRELRLQRIAEERAKQEAAKPERPPTRYKVPKRPERASEEVPVGWMPTTQPRGSGVLASKRPKSEV